MAMSIGSVTISVDASGVATYGGSGLANALGVARFSAVRSQFISTWGSPLPAAAITALQGQAPLYVTFATADATAIINHIATNAVATISTQSVGITPTPNNPATPIVGPGFVGVTIPIS